MRRCAKCGKNPAHIYQSGREHSYCVRCLNSPGESKRRFLRAYKEVVGCVDCGTTSGHLDFDHRPGTVKLFNLGHPRCSWERLLAEMEKCDVRCRSCHSRRHYALREIGMDGTLKEAA